MTSHDTSRATDAARRSDASVGRTLLRLRLVLVGPAAWGLHLFAGYLGSASACPGPGGNSPGAGGPGGPDVFIWLVTAVAALVAGAALVASIVRLLGPDRDATVGGRATTDRFIDGLAVGVNAFALGAIVLEGTWAAWMTC